MSSVLEILTIDELYLRKENLLKQIKKVTNKILEKNNIDVLSELSNNISMLNSFNLEQLILRKEILLVYYNKINNKILKKYNINNINDINDINDISLDVLNLDQLYIKNQEILKYLKEINDKILEQYNNIEDNNCILSSNIVLNIKSENISNIKVVDLINNEQTITKNTDKLKIKICVKKKK